MTPMSKIVLTALGSAALIAASTVQAQSGGKTFTVNLTGQAEVSTAHPNGGAGDLNASGSVRLTIIPGKKEACYDFNGLAGLATITMAHIHKGAAGHNGPPVVTLFTGTGGDLDGCASATSAQLAQIIAKPSQYYVNVHTTEFPDGAIRGQLSRK